MSLSAIATLEHAARAQEADAVSILTSLLRRLASGTPLPQLAAGEPPADEAALATRLAAALAQIINNPGSRLNDAAALRLTAMGRAVDNLFAISGFGNTDHILAMLGAADTAGFRHLKQQDRQALTKAWLLFSIDSQLPVDIAVLAEAPPALALLAAMKLIAQKPITTLAGHQRREQLVRLAGGLTPLCLPLSGDLMVLLSSAWMLCSYAEARDKHGIKPVLNKVLRQWGESHGLADLTMAATHPRRERPVLLVAAEVMHSNHVQYRYFGQYLRQLRQRFHLILITEQSQGDEHVKTLFDEIHTFKRGGNLEHLSTILNIARSIAPDIVFWLSVGMRHWGPVMANFRLAPIQIGGLGHCASTFVETIDYFLTEEGFIGDPDLLSEQLILLPDDSLIFERSPHYAPLSAAIRETASPLRVALASNLLKLNPHFIAVLRKIRDSSHRPVEFQVFPNVSGLEFKATQQLFDQHLPGSKIYPIKRYNDYLADLNTCDINLSPFPFGGLNGVVDSFRQGIPLITLEGPDLPGRLDSMMLRRLGMPEWLIAQDEEAYIAAALRLIEDDKERVELSRRIQALDVESVISGDASTPLRSDVIEAVWWIYQNHEQIKASGRKVFRAADRRVFP